MGIKKSRLMKKLLFSLLMVVCVYILVLGLCDIQIPIIAIILFLVSLLGFVFSAAIVFIETRRLKKEEKSEEQ